MKYLRFLSVLFSFGLFAQELPPIQNYAPVDYNGENQNWSITQSENKLVYIANNKSLLEFNGSSWSKYASPNETVIRAVKAVGNRVYSGAYMEFGFWQKDSFGILKYTSLSNKIKDDFLPDEEFWSIWEIEDWVVFQSLARIYIYNLKDASIYHIDSETTVPSLFSVDQNIYFQKKNKGIFKIESGKGSLVFDDKTVVEDEVVGIFRQGNEFLVLTRDHGFFQSRGEDLVKWQIDANELLSEVSVYTSLQLRDGTFALGTISHGLIHLNRNGNLLHHVSQINGLRNNTILSLFEDARSNLWLGMDNGIGYIDLKSPFRVYQDKRGVVGSVYATAVVGDVMYLGTNQGLFYKNKNDLSDFTLIEGTQGQVWSLNEIDDTLFCGHHRGTFLINGNSAKRIANIQGTWTVRNIEDYPNRLLQGNYDGLYVLEKDGTEWRLKNKIQGFEHSSRYVELYGADIFVNHEYKGVFKIEADSSYSVAKEVDVDTVLKGSNSGLVKYKDQLLYASKNGIARYNGQQKAFIKDSLLSLAFSENEYVSGKLIVDKRNQYLWVQTDSNIGYFMEGKLDGIPRLQSIPLTENMRDGIVGYENISVTNADTYLFGNNSGYFTVSINDLKIPEFKVEIDKIQATDIQGGESIHDKREEGKFEDIQNNINLSFFTTEYNKFLKPQYQYKLEGLYEEWSEWSSEPKVFFKNLPSADYSFKVRSRVGNTISTNIASYSFIIARPWYFSNIMFSLYLIGAILLGVAIHNLYKGYYHKRQNKLIEENQRQIELARAQNEKEIVQLKNEQLKKEFQNKSNELAASTMSIIKKNELLSKAKEQLVANVEEKESVKPIIDIIDKNLNQNDDWELFKEAFNNADRKFLKKLKKVHPNLSPNDIRLCAYLRLNLSSKEIAPLLNISARSVEIKRYRLRKKMGLEHDDNLVNYILTL
ncbi:helix-turn-helix and ligand-binding sensor domain-containing protein [Flagellimonas meridianipacifica]|uniref:Regulatory LuxR family protein n=1 Tax=Flagellimonas meridianipacifica TaxID=1080225 RepID=A0A2T0MCX5_9FLAO|nr:triple tyrosine motif-containing protein [Allomuricauda pacifica]PRX55345.1 regulatory LuxR family protein [Allomuricauda pacifica]